jgi:hypothetical protein
MPIPSSNFSATILGTELHIQCTLAERYAEQLEKSAQHWIDLSQGKDFDNKAAPIDIIAECTVVLASLAAIRRLLFDCGRADPKVHHRCAALRDLLGNPPLPNVSSAVVRNSWEHLDERLDDLLPSLTSRANSHIHVAAKSPNAGTVVLKHFDPVAFTIHFANQTIALRPCIGEVAALKDCIDQAFVKLQNERIDVWGA